MRGQWINYDNFRLVELIDEVKTRIVEPHNIEDVVHGALIVGRDYYGLCKELKDYLEKDDKKSEVKDYPSYLYSTKKFDQDAFDREATNPNNGHTDRERERYGNNC